MIVTSQFNCGRPQSFPDSSHPEAKIFFVTHSLSPGWQGHRSLGQGSKGSAARTAIGKKMRSASLQRRPRGKESMRPRRKIPPAPLRRYYDSHAVVIWRAAFKGITILFWPYPGGCMRAPQSCPAVLIAEDENLFAILLEAWIEDQHMKPLGPVSSIQGAKDVLEQDDMPDAAILDIELRGESVFPVAHILQQRGVPFFFVTGCAYSPPAPFENVPLLAKPTSKFLVLPMLYRILRIPPNIRY
jgi:CheY-like chemotaxis protein